MNDPTSASASGASQLRPRGSNQIGMRQYNERVVLHAIRLHGDLPKAELARLTHLSTQTVSLIVNKLLDDQLLIKREPLRGRIGQPSIPIALNPDGAFALGLKVGRRSAEVILIDFIGTVRQRWSLDYRYPDPELLPALVERAVADLPRQLDVAALDRIQGLGIAMPFSLGGWQTLLDMPPEVAARWPQTDLRAEIARRIDWPVMRLKDTTAACTAELVAGRGQSLHSFLYLFIDTFIGGGLVLDSQLHAGAGGNAGAVASMPLQRALPGSAAPAQVLSLASLLTLQTHYEQAGLDAAAALDDRALESPWLDTTETWLDQAASAIALVIVHAGCLLDLEHVILDGILGRALLQRLMLRIESVLDAHSWEGVSRPQLQPGTIGPDASALGGALLPLHAAFAPDPGVFLK
jgi:predicted NBD/HSP70 family sugar kinase